MRTKVLNISESLSMTNTDSLDARALIEVLDDIKDDENGISNPYVGLQFFSKKYRLNNVEYPLNRTYKVTEVEVSYNFRIKVNDYECIDTVVMSSLPEVSSLSKKDKGLTILLTSGDENYVPYKVIEVNNGNSVTYKYINAKNSISIASDSVLGGVKVDPSKTVISINDSGRIDVNCDTQLNGFGCGLVKQDTGGDEKSLKVNVDEENIILYSNKLSVNDISNMLDAGEGLAYTQSDEVSSMIAILEDEFLGTKSRNDIIGENGIYYKVMNDITPTGGDLQKLKILLDLNKDGVVDVTDQVIFSQYSLNPIYYKKENEDDYRPVTSYFPIAITKLKNLRQRKLYSSQILKYIRDYILGKVDFDEDFDFNNDGVINVSDLNLFSDLVSLYKSMNKILRVDKTLLQRILALEKIVNPSITVVSVTSGNISAEGETRTYKVYYPFIASEVSLNAVSVESWASISEVYDQNTKDGDRFYAKFDVTFSPNNQSETYARSITFEGKATNGYLIGNGNLTVTQNGTYVPSVNMGYYGNVAVEGLTASSTLDEIAAAVLSSLNSDVSQVQSVTLTSSSYEIQDFTRVIGTYLTMLMPATYKGQLSSIGEWLDFNGQAPTKGERTITLNGKQYYLYGEGNGTNAWTPIRFIKK